MNHSPTTGDSFDELFASRLTELPPWQATILRTLRTLVRQAAPAVVEEWKWNIPVWTHDGMLCTGETYKTYVKVTFAHGAKISDPRKVFNAGFGGGTRRAIDIKEGDAIDAAGVKALVQAAVAFNQARTPATKKPATKKPAAKKPAAKKPAAKKPAAKKPPAAKKLVTKRAR